MFIEFLVEAEDAVGNSEFQKLDEFFYRDLADIGEIGAGRNFKQNGHQWDSRDSVGNKGKFTKRPHTRIHKIESGSECVSECSVASDFEEHLKEEAAPTPVSSRN